MNVVYASLSITGKEINLIKSFYQRVFLCTNQAARCIIQIYSNLFFYRAIQFDEELIICWIRINPCLSFKWCYFRRGTYGGCLTTRPCRYTSTQIGDFQLRLRPGFLRRHKLFFVRCQ